MSEGRWEIVGGMWVEPDLNMPSGESLVRQVLAGKRYFLEKFGVDTTRFTVDRVPTIYHLNLRDPSGMLLASAFQMKIKDVMYVANAKVVDYYKLLLLINNTAATTSNTANAVTNVNTAVKTRW